MIERLLRWTAVGIVIAAFVDPAIEMSGRTRPRISVVVQGGPSMELPARAGGLRTASSGAQPDESRREAARRVRDTLADRLRQDFVLEEGLDTTADAVVVLGDRYPDERLPESARVSTIALSSPSTPNVRIADVTAPVAVPPGTAVPLTVEVEGSGLTNATTTLVVRTAGVELARAEHRWSAASETWRTDLAVAPVGEPPFAFEVGAEPLPSERTAADNLASIGVELAPPLRVLALEARPSWASAFVRRALEGDPRFEVSGVSEPSPRGAVRSGALPNLDPARLDAFDVILVGGLDRLSTASATTLDRFMRERGGAVVLLPDALIPEAIGRQLLGGVVLRERLLERPAALATGRAPRIDASELLEAVELPAGGTVIASSTTARSPTRDPGATTSAPSQPTPGTTPPASDVRSTATRDLPSTTSDVRPTPHDAVVWTTPRRAGRLLVSGAMDAWRSRAEPQVAFDRFWQSVVSGLALAAEPAVSVDLLPRRAAPGERVRIVARVRSLERERLRDRFAISARIGARDPIRLWPDASPGLFTGSFVVDTAQGAAPLVTATIDDGVASGSAHVTVDRHAREAAGPPLALLARTHGGVDVSPDGLGALERHLRATTQPASTRAVRHPLRSVWWLPPICVALSSEWWLRRRRGAR